jgi:hypothetical protein
MIHDRNRRGSFPFDRRIHLFITIPRIPSLQNVIIHILLDSHSSLSPHINTHPPSLQPLMIDYLQHDLPCYVVRHTLS